MNSYKIICIAIIAASLTVAGSAFAANGAASSEVRFNVSLKPGQSRQDVINSVAARGGKLLFEIPEIGSLTFTAPSAAYLPLQDKLIFSSAANSMDLDTKSHICPVSVRPVSGSSAAGGITAVPNDTQYGDQWGPACIGAEDMWDLLTGNPSVIVAVIDTGVDLDHPDLVNNVDTSIDYDFVNSDDDSTDDNGHGSHVAGTIAAEYNNSLGVAGLQQVTIMGIKGLDSFGSGWNSDLAQSIVYAVNNGANVINCSWGGYGPDLLLYNAVNYAFQNGIIVIAAAGNDGISASFYPAAYPKAVGVSALTDCTTIASFSNFGFQNVRIAAPGDDILSTYHDGGYAYMSGTSMAAPHVTGVVATYLSFNPSLPFMNILRHMALNADDLGTPGVDQFYGFGRVDMYPFD